MREEATKGALILPLAAVNERVKAATGVSLRTISRISLEGKNVEQGGVASFSTPNDKRPNRKSPKALNDSERANLRRVIENLRSTEKTVPSLRSIHKQFCHEYNYQGCVETLRKEVNRIGFRWNKGFR
ncbi:hypothetical protein JTB14_012930 [Gonioctena quinquepunctata]|nr:hypothetical protein JTB14_012930 [Gonioctena quinquepunctata]